ncbi:hypothetical protein [Hymenobacter chitinivorans]|uniref:SdpC family antimicrobial peptide n=1 Tax=Hymenobacter chitinivorans DSM 11115 TaxID=1121954 RepID=A0A2M9BMU7_9BACT|nr:hypothetical protein [Hymenobacter chitinivorans]PJJ59220.1 SdpC family antimicrobial peptide [Hymenobacter chitinivorans DSM 11115]
MAPPVYSLSSLKTLGLITAVSLLAPSCGPNEVIAPDAPTAKSQQEKVDYSGEELFRGIFFFEGRVAEQIPSFDAYRATIRRAGTQHHEVLVKRAHTVDALVKGVRSIYPTYFIELKQAIQSENFERIKGVIRKGTALNEAAALATLTSPEEKQAFLQRRQVIQSLNMAAYDFKKEQDLKRFVQDSKQALTEAGYESSQPIQDEVEYAFVYQQTDVFAYQYSSVVIAESVHAWFEQLADQSGTSQLEMELLIKELADNLN